MARARARASTRTRTRTRSALLTGCRDGLGVDLEQPEVPQLSNQQLTSDSTRTLLSHQHQSSAVQSPHLPGVERLNHFQHAESSPPLGFPSPYLVDRQPLPPLNAAPVLSSVPPLHLCLLRSPHRASSALLHCIDRRLSQPSRR